MTNCEGGIMFFKKFSQQGEKFERQEEALLQVRPHDLVRILGFTSVEEPVNFFFVLYLLFFWVLLC